MIKIVIDDAIPYVKGVLEPFCSVEYIDGRTISNKDIRDADALMIRTRTRCDATLLEGTRVRAIATATIGYDHIDMAWCREAGIGVFTAAGCNARGVLQWLAAVLDLDSDKYGWQPQDMTIGIVGTGNVGSLAAKYAALWGFSVLCCDPPRQKTGLPSPVGDEYVDMGEIARLCDIVTFHVPLTLTGEDATYHMAGERFFSSLKPGTLVMNSSRGEITDTASFSSSIRGWRCRAAVDTWEREPDIARPFLNLTMVGTPHIAGYTSQGKANASVMSVRSLADFFGLHVKGWYPSQVEKTVVRDIAWKEMKQTIKRYFDIGADDARLRSDPSRFEELRTNYKYRQEYF